MKNIYGSHFRKTAACALSMLLFAALLFSTVFFFVEAEHDCKGEECHICECFQRIEAVIYKISGTGTVKMILTCLPVLTEAAVLLGLCKGTEKTPVLNNVRLND